MPFIDESQRLDLSRVIDVPKGFAVTPGAEDLEVYGPERPGWNWAAAFRRNNELAAAVSSESAWMDNEPEAGFNPWNKIKGTEKEADWSKYVGVRNSRKFDAVTRDIEREREDRKILDSQPWWQSLITEGTASVLSPTTLLPGGAFVRGAKGGLALVRTTASVGGAAAGGTAVQEAALHSIEQTRTLGESATAIGASAFIGGLLGAGGTALLSRSEWARAVDGMNRELGGEVRSDPIPMEPGDVPIAVSAGSAATERADIEGLSIAGRAAGALAKATGELNPALRLLQSPNPETRQVGAQLFENSLYLKQNMEGLTEGAAVETLMKEWNGGLITALRSTDEAYSSARKAGYDGTHLQFREEVGKAMRRSDTHENPEVDRVAKAWRKNVFDPLKDAAIKAGLLPADVTTETAASYFSRMWNQNKLVRREGEFKGIVHKWVLENAPKWEREFEGSIARRVNPLYREVDDLETRKLRRAEELRRRDEEGEVEAGEFSEADIRSALRFIESGQKPKKVKTLTQFVVDEGGLLDHAGEIVSMGGRARVGLIRTEARKTTGGGKNIVKGGWRIDDMARHAWENGFFPEHQSRPDANDFLDALSDDLNKRRFVVREADRPAIELAETVARIEEDLARIGITDTKGARFSTSEEVKGLVARVAKAADADADAKIAVLRSRIKEIETEGRVEKEARFGDEQTVQGFAEDIANQVFDRLTGKAIDAGLRPEFIKITSRGPLKERTFNIPDELVLDFLEHDVAAVGRRYTRIMGADVELANKFGDVNMTQQLQAVRDRYREMRQGVTNEKELAKLDVAEKADITDLQATRDLLRHTYNAPGEAGNWAAITRSANAFNYVRSMGEVVLASLTDAVRPAMVHGLRQFMADIPQFANNLAAVRLSVKEAQLAGNVAERVLQARMGTLTEVIDPYSGRGPVESLLAKMTDLASKWNGIRLWTEMMQSVATVMTQNRVLDNVSRYGNVSQKDKAYLAFLGINESMAGRIAKQFAEHGQTLDGVRVAGTEAWNDDVARRAYRAAINKDVDSIIVQKSVADVPLVAHTPTGRTLLQFKTFALASHQRVLLRGLQEDQARFVGGMISLTMMGMFMTYLKAVTGNRTEKLEDIGKNPGWWVAEGLDRSGILSVPMELANMFEKATGYIPNKDGESFKFNPIKAGFTAFDEGSAISQKNQNKDIAGAILGPSLGLVEDTIRSAGSVATVLGGEDRTQAQKNATERLMPYNSYAGMRQMLRYVVNPPE